MFENNYGEYVPSRADNVADVIAMRDVGGMGTLIYHTFRFKGYEYDEDESGLETLKPLVYEGLEPDLDRYNSPKGSDIFVALYNLGDRVNSFDEHKSFGELMIEFCLTVAHPYYIDSVYEILSEQKLSIKREGNLISDEAMFSTEQFKRDLERFYNGARCYFALRQISDGESCDYLSLWEDGRHFAGINLFDAFHCPVMLEDKTDDIDKDDPDEAVLMSGKDEDGNTLSPKEYRERSREYMKKLMAEAEEHQKRYEKFIEQHKDELYKYIPESIDDFYRLRGRLMDMIPDFHMRLKVDSKSDKVVFAADVHSIFDIAWYTLARYMVDVQLADEGITEKRYSNGKVCVCKCCGKAFVRTADQNRRQYCGDPACERKRARERTQRKREKDKIEEQKISKKRKIKSVNSADTFHQ